jgi:hypothetical protein
MCKARFKPNPFISISINKLSGRCEMLFDYLTIKEPMQIINMLNNKITKGHSYSRDMKKEAEVYTYYTGYNNHEQKQQESQTSQI